MSRAYGVLVEEEGSALRGMFVVNPEGVLKPTSVNDVAVGRSVLEALRLLQAFKAEADLGVFCAANWRPGAQNMTIVPTEEGRKEYLANNFRDSAVFSQPGTPGRGERARSDNVGGGGGDGGGEVRTRSSSERELPAVGVVAEKDHPLLAVNGKRQSHHGIYQTKPTLQERLRGTNASASDGATSPRRLGLDTFSKMFNARGASSPLMSPMISSAEMEKLNERNASALVRHGGGGHGGGPGSGGSGGHGQQGHRHMSSVASQSRLKSKRSYFDFEPTA
ncbi:hypothetical protein K402DRAFT_437753 [Aulographum hederae CBS 113979]|uniref:Uncharacterized protein n=1 Tax=Aulographum hederae CBS 113979 TaxID=1176131 RepID=A0A6G1GNX5_9PEZI|nr:hypothetical protein K402DRAFT_437753 [Aulographum hederae CBS 113979]